VVQRVREGVSKTGRVRQKGKTFRSKLGKVRIGSNEGRKNLKNLVKKNKIRNEKLNDKSS